MSRHFRPEPLPSGVHFKAPPMKVLYQPTLDQDTSNDFHVEYARVDAVSPVFPVFPGTKFMRNEGPHRNALLAVERTVPPWARSTAPLPPNETPQVLCLPLLRVSVEATVDGIVSSTALTQYFNNESNETIPEAHYTFPLYDGAVVTSFQYDIGDRVFVGEVKPKQEARADFQKAVEKQRAAALLEEHTPEVFETLVGNIPANTIVKVKITYVNVLRVSVLDGGKEALDVVIPMSIAPRYGTPFGSHSRTHYIKDDGLDIMIKVNNNGTIQDLKSPTHGTRVKIDRDFIPDKIEVQSFDQLSRKIALTQMSAVYESRASIMDQDFVLRLEMLPSHPLRSRAVLSPVNKEGQAALMVNIKPSELFKSDYQPQNFDGEIIFVLDRSGSMGWHGGQRDGRYSDTTKIATIRRAMPLSLTSLPINCAFNIVSFGNNSEFLWNESQPYTNENRKYAMDFARRADANLGGTELLFALQQAVESRLQNRRSTQVIIITDGEVEAEATIDFVRKKRLELRDRIRFFALGIGDQVSHRLIESIGEFGGGYGEVVNLSAKPKWEDSLSRMLKSGIAPDSWDLDFDLGPGFQQRSLFDYELGRDSPRTKNVPYFQAPYPSVSLHPFRYQSVFFLFDSDSSRLPRQIILRPQNPGTKHGIEHSLTIEPVQKDRSTIHHLAAKAILTSLQQESDRGDLEEHISHCARLNAENLGTVYSIASRWTSLVAIDQENQNFSEVSASKAEMIEIDIHSHSFAPLRKWTTKECKRVPRGPRGQRTPRIRNSLYQTEDSEISLDQIGSFERQSIGTVTIADQVIGNTADASAHLTPTQIMSSRPQSRKSASWPKIPIRLPEYEQRSTSDDHDSPSTPTLNSQSPQLYMINLVQAQAAASPPLLARASTSNVNQDTAHSTHDSSTRNYITTAGAYDYQGFAIPSPVITAMEGSGKMLSHEEFWSNYPKPGRLAGSATQQQLLNDADGEDEDGSEAWMVFIDAQTSQGLFELPEPANKTMQEHFCSGTSAKLDEVLEDRSRALKLSSEVRRAVTDTLMTIQYFEVHLAKEKDLWEMMMDKAEYAVRQTLQLPDTADDDMFAVLKRIVDGASKHRHFHAVSKELTGTVINSFPPSETGDACPSCGVKSQAILQLSGKDHDAGSLLFRCLFERCETPEARWSRWDDLWKHQVENGHVICGTR